MKNILEKCIEQKDYLIKVRRHLHEHPELTSKEFHTIRYIQEELTALDVPYTTIPDGGIIAALSGDRAGKTVLLRADCDALPIEEATTNAKYAKKSVSRVAGVAHMCGHDAHTAMLLTAIKLLKANKAEIKGTILFLFERGEEGGNCIYYVMKAIQEKQLAIDACFGIHVDPAIEVGKIGVRKGILNAGNVNFEIKINGKGGHASRPDQASNPIDCFFAIGNALKDLRLKDIQPQEQLTYTIASVHAGVKRNVIPESLTFLGTARFHSREVGIIFKEKFRQILETVGALYDCAIEFVEYTGPSFPVVNQPQIAEISKKAIEQQLGAKVIVENPISLGSESFATLAAFYPAAFLRLGVRNEEKGITESVHQPRFDLDEDALPYGSAIHIISALSYLDSDESIEFQPFSGTADDFLKETARPVPKRYDTE